MSDIFTNNKTNTRYSSTQKILYYWKNTNNFYKITIYLIISIIFLNCYMSYTERIIVPHMKIIRINNSSFKIDKNESRQYHNISLQENLIQQCKVSVFN